MSKMIKAIMCDLDGTLLNKDKKILNETKRALKEAQENGIRLILASSRSYFMLEDIIKEFDRWLDEELDFKERYEIPADKYIGWLSNT